MDYELLKQKYKKQNHEITRINTIYATKLRNFEIKQNKLLQANIDLTMKLNKVKKMIKNCLSYYYEFKNGIYSVDSQKKEYLEKIFNTLYNIMIAIDDEKYTYNSVKDRPGIKNSLKKSFNSLKLNTISDENEYEISPFSYITSNNEELLIPSKKRKSPPMDYKNDTLEIPPYDSDMDDDIPQQPKKTTTAAVIIPKPFRSKDNFPYTEKEDKIDKSPIITKTASTNKSKVETSPFFQKSKSSKEGKKDINNDNSHPNNKREIYIENLDDIPIVVKKEDLKFLPTSSLSSSPPFLSLLPLSPSPPLPKNFDDSSLNIDESIHDQIITSPAEKKSTESFNQSYLIKKNRRSSFIIMPNENVNEEEEDNDNDNDNNYDYSLYSISSDDISDSDDDDDQIVNNDNKNGKNKRENNTTAISDSNIISHNNIIHKKNPNTANNHSDFNNTNNNSSNYNYKDTKLKNNKSSNRYYTKNNYSNNKKDNDDDNDNKKINNSSNSSSRNSNNKSFLHSTVKKNKRIKKDIEIKTITTSSTSSFRSKTNSKNKIATKKLLMSPYKSPIHYASNKENIHSNRRSHRHKNIINYALPSIRSKLRRGDKDYGCGIIRPLNNPYGVNTFSHKDDKENK